MAFNKKIINHFTIPIKISALILLFVGSPLFAQQVDVQTFVRQTFIHGVPYAKASQYTTADATLLLQMLTDENEIAHRNNIVVTLAMIGDERAVEPLLSLITTRTAQTLTRQEYTLKTSALISLGYLVNKTNNLQALTYLIDGIRATVWVERNLLWASPFHANETERNQQLVSLSIIGLALSGHTLAREALIAYQLNTGLSTSERALIDEALRAHTTIANQGLAVYYQNEM